MPHMAPGLTWLQRPNRSVQYKASAIQEVHNQKAPARRKFQGAGVLKPIGSMVLLYMVCHGSHQYTPLMLAYIPYMDPMGREKEKRKKNTRCSPRTRMLTRMLMVQMVSTYMQSRRTLFCNSLFEQSCTHFPCYPSAVWSGRCGVCSGKCRVCSKRKKNRQHKGNESKSKSEKKQVKDKENQKLRWIIWIWRIGLHGLHGLVASMASVACQALGPAGVLLNRGEATHGLVWKCWVNIPNGL